MRRHPLAAGLVAALLFGGLLRVLRAGIRWDEVALAYAAYPEPTVRALASGDLASVASGWAGLHPPLYPVLHATSELLFPVPAVWLLASAAFSLGAVALVGRTGGSWAAIALAVAPLQLAYCAEVNNYPLAVLLVAFVLFAAPGPWPRLAVAAVLAGWCHLLAGLAGVAVVGGRLVRPRAPGERLPLAASVILGLLPVGVGAIRRMGQESTWGQPEAGLSEWAGRAAEGIGWPALALALVGLLGLRRSALLAALGAGGALALALLLGAAAPHQRPYLALLGPPLALGLARLADRAGTPVKMGIGLLLVIQAGSAAGPTLAAARGLLDDQAQARGIDLALARSEPGDALWLVAPALQPDDDKDASSPVLWRIRPWTWMPQARPVPFEYLDYRYGQPRMHRGRTVHTSTELDPTAFDHVTGEVLGRGRRVFVLLYEHRPATGLAERVERALRPYDFDCEEVGFSPTGEGLSLSGDGSLGRDRLCLVP